jgi:hypothetical protein
MKAALALLCLLLPVIAYGEEKEWFTDDEIAKIERELGIDLNNQQDAPMSVQEREDVVEQLAIDMQDLQKAAIRTDAALNRIVRYASVVLKRRGNIVMSKRIVFEYQKFYQFAVTDYYMGIQRTDLGDHPPLWQWLADWYDKIEDKLGERLMKILRLYDLKVLNYAIPVVFQPRGDRRTSPLMAWGRDEYRLHFVPYGGVVAYWTAWGVCVGATWGAGIIAFICGPVGWGAEWVTVKYIAPPVSDFVYDSFNDRAMCYATQ